jgi:hypothetical protein
MKYSRQLHKVKPSGFTRTIDSKPFDIYLSVFGIFDTEKANWTYYYTSCCDNGGHIYMTNDCSKASTNLYTANVINISAYAHSCKTPEDGLKWCEDFKMKWDTGSNDLISEVRDKKLDQLLS